MEMGHRKRATPQDAGDAYPVGTFTEGIAGIQLERTHQLGQSGGVVTLDHALDALVQVVLSQVPPGDPVGPPALLPPGRDQHADRQRRDADALEHRLVPFQSAQPFHRRPSLKQGQVGEQGIGAMIPPIGVLGARMEQHFVEFEQIRRIRPVAQVRPGIGRECLAGVRDGLTGWLAGETASSASLRSR